MRLSIIATVVLAVASMAMAAPNVELTWTVTKAPACNNANGTPIIYSTDNIWDIQVYAHDLDGNADSWALNITSTATIGTIHHMLGGKYSDMVVDTQANAIAYDAPSHPANSNYKNDGYSMNGDTWLGSNWSLIGAPGIFTQPYRDDDYNVIGYPNEWDLHIGTPPLTFFSNILVGQWAVDLGTATTGNLQIQGTIAYSGWMRDLGIVNIPVPEPVTMSLLALGGLSLLRRRALTSHIVRLSKTKIPLIGLVILAAASMAMAANPGLTWTVTKVGSYTNNNGSAIVTNTGTDGTGNMTLNAGNTLYDVQIFANDPTGSTIGSWAFNITSTATVGTIYQSLGSKYTDMVVDTQANASTYDAPSHRTSANYKNDNYSMYADTWLSSNFYLIGAPGNFTQPTRDADGEVIIAPNEWDLHIGTPTNTDWGNTLVGQWCVNLGANASGNLQVTGLISRAGMLYDLGTINIPVPEPLTASFLGLGGLALLRRRAFKSQFAKFNKASIPVIGLIVLAGASMAMAAPQCGLTWTVTRAPACNNADGTPIISSNDNIWDVQVFTYDPSTATGAWAINITSTATVGTIHQMLGGKYGDAVVNTQADAITYDAPSHPTSTNFKNDGYSMYGDTWLAGNWSLIADGAFTPPYRDGDYNVIGYPNEWDLHIGTAPAVFWGSGLFVGQWAVNLGTSSTGNLQIRGTVTHSYTCDLGTLNIPVPEPVTMSLLGCGSLVLLCRRRACAATFARANKMRLSVIALVVFAVASMALAATPGLKWTVTKVGSYTNNNGSAIVTNTGTDGIGNMTLDASNTLYDVQVFTNDPTGCTTGGWVMNITSTATVGTIYQSLGGRYNDTVVDTQANALVYDAPSHPTSSNYKNDNFSMCADTWLASNWELIANGIFVPPYRDSDYNVIGYPNEWDLHISNLPATDFGNILVGQWCVDLGANVSGNLQIQGTIVRAGQMFDLGAINIPVPEPVTVSLLGFGGLALLRRRR